MDHRNTKALLFRAAELDPLGTWRLVSVHLSDEKEGRRFAVGFPRGLLDRLPLSNVWEWIVEEPRKRAGTVARLVAKNLKDDNSLGARILGEFGDARDVASWFFAAFATGFADGGREREDEERIDER